MRRLSFWLFVLCVFVAGVFFGIWMDWHGAQFWAGNQSYTYVVQDYQKANLAIGPGDSINLLGPDGTKLDLLMNFVGGKRYSPCTGGVSVNPCVVKQKATKGPFFFTCSSQKYGYTCPDPGVQQSPGGPFMPPAYLQSLESDVSHLFATRSVVGPSPAPPTTTVNSPPTTAVNAFVGCSDDTNATVLEDFNGNPLPPITAKAGASVFWISSQPFSIDTSSGFPAGLCTNGNPGGTGNKARCDIASNATQKAYSYVVQAQTTPACSALPTTLTVTP